jgi:hypothetical protein
MKLDLSNVTAICIDGRPVDPARQANYQTILKYMLSCVTFGKIKMISLEDPMVDGVEFIQIEPLTIQEYSQFCINKLHSYVDTEFCLVFQDDGFILNPELWSADFLKYDYIGAPWPLYIGWPTVGSQVGNGGFSLRSKKLLEFTKNLNCTLNEDVLIAVVYKTEIADAGLTIAPVELATRFAVEIPMDSTHVPTDTFGFHAKNLAEEAFKIINNK